MRRLLVAIALAALGLAPVPAAAQTTPTCFGREVTLLGTDGKDQLYGTPGHDVIASLGGDDYVRGFTQGGDDLKDWICGGAESDSLHGDYGNDWIDGERGNDGIVGEDGQDRLFGGGGNDYLNGLSGSDFVDGGEGVDTIPLDTDNRTPRWTSDTIHGGEGGDFVGGTTEGSKYALFGSDSFYGDAGNDQVVGTRSKSLGEAPGAPDLVDGGPGKDTCWVDTDDTVVNCEEVIELPPCTTCEPGGPSRARRQIRETA